LPDRERVLFKAYYRMNQELILKQIGETISDVVPEKEIVEVGLNDSFKSLGLNSIERMEITMLLIEEMEIDIQRSELLPAGNFGEMIDIILSKN